MATELTLRAAEKGTYVVDGSFTDENGDAVIPNAIAWTLTDGDGNVVNERNEVAIDAAASITILLKGDDLTIDGYPNSRVVTVEWTYNSSLGDDLPMKAAARFRIDNLLAVT